MNEKRVRNEGSPKINPAEARQKFINDLASRGYGQERIYRSASEVDNTFKLACEALRVALRDRATVDALSRHPGIPEAARKLLGVKEKDGGIAGVRKKSPLDIKEIVLAVAGSLSPDYSPDSARNKLDQSYQDAGRGLGALFTDRRYNPDDVFAFIMIASHLRDVSTEAADQFRKIVDVFRDPDREHRSQTNVPNRYAGVTLPLLRDLVNPYQYVDDFPRYDFEGEVQHRTREQNLGKLVERFFSHDALRTSGVKGEKADLDAIAFYLQEQVSILLYHLLKKPAETTDQRLSSSSWNQDVINILPSTGMSIRITVEKNKGGGHPLSQSEDRKRQVIQVLDANQAAIKKIVSDFMNVFFETGKLVTAEKPEAIKGVRNWQMKRDYAGAIIFERIPVPQVDIARPVELGTRGPQRPNTFNSNWNRGR